MLNCRQVARLVAELLDNKPISWTQRVQLWMHLAMCGLCQRFRRTMLRIDRELKSHAQDTPPVPGRPTELSRDRRTALQQLLRQSSDSDE